MAGWAGFSEEELRSLKMKQDLPHTVDRPRRQPTATKNRQQLQRKMALQLQSQQLAKQDGVLSVPVEQQLSRPKANTPPAPVAGTSPTGGKQVPGEQPKSPVPVTTCTNSKPQDINIEQDGHLTKKEMELREKTRLDQLQLEQRLMEEKNKRKKALLAKAIAERSKKTQAEAVKLKRIQKQLQALDDLVSTDIGILRNRIDQACLEFSQAKKRYDKAEVEYIAAKLDLHKKTELKEQLTEHLCTIIQQNEARKAKRLEELMQQLEVEADEEKLELEIEVDQMLHQQEAETKRNSVAPEVKQELASSVEEHNQSSTTEKDTEDEVLAQSTLQLPSESSAQENSTDQETSAAPREEEAKTDS
ncbi:RAB6-interacting golgin [Rhinophrynus dorsalis]